MWRLIDSGPGPGALNLALDEAIFRSVRDGVSPPTLRFYAWSAPTLSLGYTQDRARDVNLEACSARGIAVVRRITGGRAVLHDREVTYSVCAPAGASLFGTGLEVAYRTVAAGLVAGLRQLGLAAVAGLRDPTRRGRHPGCFAASARHEIEVGGRKIVGSAQRRVRGAFLQQGSILLESHETLLGQVLLPGAAAAPGKMAGLAEFLPHCPTYDAVAAAIAAGCERAWGVTFLAGALCRAETLLARELEGRRYGSEEWNAGRRLGAPAV